jgi:Zn-dependent alcohol dehydrogenase
MGCGRAGGCPTQGGPVQDPPHEKTLKGTFFGNYKPRTDLPNVVEMYMKKVI